MNPEELGIAIKIAEIEGEGCYISKANRGVLSSIDGVPYNPFKGSILCALMVKYEVYIDYSSGYVFILTNDIHEDLEVLFDNKHGIPMAILKCIIEAYG